MELNSTSALGMSACTKKRSRNVGGKGTASYESRRKHAVLKVLKSALEEGWGTVRIYEALIRETEKIPSPVLKKVPGTTETLEIIRSVMDAEISLDEMEEKLIALFGGLPADNADTLNVGNAAFGVLDALRNGKAMEDVYRDFIEKAVDIEIRLYASQMERCINRFIHSESRTLILDPPANQVSLNDGLIETAVNTKDIAVFNGRNYLEIIKFKASKPWYTQGEETKNSVMNSLELYSLFCYGRDMLPAGSKKIVRAGYYYLQKRSDSRNQDRPNFEPDFFTGDESNVVYIEAEVDKTLNPLGNPTELDAHFAPLVEAFYEGKSEEEAHAAEDCEKCSMKAMCQYRYAPKHIVKEKKAKSLSDIVLTDDQEAAVNFTKGLLRINAGAGAGKTLIVALRVVNLLMAGVKPEEICLLTFTNTGAAEMRERIALYNSDFSTGADVTKLISTTFNGFANQVVADNYAELGFTDEPRLIDEIEKSEIIASLIKAHYVKGLNYNNFLMNTRYVKGALPLTIVLFDIIKKYKFGRGDDDAFWRKVKDQGLYRFASLINADEMFDLFAEYDEILKSSNLIEYADQEILMFDFIADHPDYFESLGIRHVIVDEFQDSDANQIELIKQLRDCPTFESLMVVGDDSQSIFSFRDTSPEYIINFFDVMGEDGEDIYLLENHRSTEAVIDLANKINTLNVDKVDKDLIATREHGVEPVVKGFYSKKTEYDWICDSIREKVENGTAPEDIAVIVSDKFEIQDIMSELTLRDVPCVSLNPVVFLENSRVNAAISLAKMFDNPSDENSALVYLNALTDNTLLDKGDDEIETLVMGLSGEVDGILKMNEAAKLSEFRKLLEVLDAEDTDEVYAAFLEKIKFRRTFRETVSYMVAFELYGGKATHKLERDYPGVVVTTAHSSKGMEWPIVYNSITKYHKKEMGSYTSRAKRPGFEEKRRLLFVSITRAKDELYVTGQYVAYGPKEDRTYNCYLREVHEALGKMSEYIPVDPEEEKKDAERKEAARRKAAERRALEREARLLNMTEEGKKRTPKGPKDFDAEANALAAALKEIEHSDHFDHFS